VGGGGQREGWVEGGFEVGWVRDCRGCGKGVREWHYFLQETGLGWKGGEVGYRYQTAIGC